jgi:hypothetical protein
MYGFPTPEMWLASERGEAAIGGCVVNGDSPNHACLNCHARWHASRSDVAVTGIAGYVRDPDAEPG